MADYPHLAVPWFSVTDPIDTFFIYDPQRNLEPKRQFSVLDQLIPHPVYATQSWVSVLNPSAETFESIQPLLSEAYAMAVKRHASGSRTR